MLGRPDAAAHPRARSSLLADTSDDPNELARAARALRALGRFQEANAAYPAGRDDGARTTRRSRPRWGELFLEKYNKPRR